MGNKMTSRPRCKNYSDCAERVYPRDPEASIFHHPANPDPEWWKHSTCDSCYSYQCPEEVLSYPEEVTEPEWTKRQWDAVKQLKAIVLHLQNKIVESSKKKKQEKTPF